MVNTDKVDERIFVNSLEKGFRVLSVFGLNTQELGIGEIAELTGLNRSAAQRFTTTLYNLGYLTRDSKTRRFRPSVKCLTFAETYLSTDDLIRIAMPVMIKLAQETGKSVNFSICDGNDFVHAIRLPNNATLWARTIIGRRLPLPIGSAGRAIMAFLPDEDVDEILNNWDKVKHTPKTIIDPNIIRNGLLQVAECGYSIAIQQTLMNSITVAAPVFDRSQQPIAAVMLALPFSDWTEQSVEEQWAPLVVEAATSISANPR